MNLIRTLAATSLLILGSRADSAETAAPPEGFTQLPRVPIYQREFADERGRKLTYYLSRPKGTAPLMLMIQGSGCVPVVNQKGGYSTMFNFVPFAQEGRFSVMVVEKPDAPPESKGTPGEADGCGTRFNEEFTAESWLAALRAALADARRQSWVDGRRTLVFGISEGAVMAAMLAAREEGITDVVAIGMSGTTQLYDFLAGAYRSCKDVPACIADIEAKARAIAAEPSSADKFAWGHPYRRWASFFAVDASVELLRSRARVYLAFGMEDASVPALSQEIAAAKLQAAGRDVTVRRIVGAGHDLMPVNAPDFAVLDREFRAALDWFWRRPN